MNMRILILLLFTFHLPLCSHLSSLWILFLCFQYSMNEIIYCMCAREKTCSNSWGNWMHCTHTICGCMYFRIITYPSFPSLFSLKAGEILKLIIGRNIKVDHIYSVYAYSFITAKLISQFDLRRVITKKMDAIVAARNDFLMYNLKGERERDRWGNKKSKHNDESNANN